MTTEGDQTKTRLLTAARDHYLDTGLARFSLREVARRARVSAAAVYRHYHNKEALLQAVCGEGFRVFYSYLVRALEAPTVKERMAVCTAQYLRFALENPRDYRFIFMGALEDFVPLAPPSSAKDRGNGHEPTFQFLVDRVRECMQEHLLRKGDPDRVATVIWSHVHGLASLRLSGHLAGIGSDAKFTRFYTAATDQLLSGLAQ